MLPLYMEKILCSLLLLVAVVEVSHAVSCIQCNSEYDPRCADPIDRFSLGIVNCSLKPPLEHLPDLEPVLCRKVVQKTFGKIRVVRGCGYIRDEERDDLECIRRLGTHEVQAVYCSCTTDLCNDAKSTHQNINKLLYALISSVLSIGVLLFHRLG